MDVSDIHSPPSKRLRYSPASQDSNEKENKELPPVSKSASLPSHVDGSSSPIFSPSPIRKRFFDSVAVHTSVQKPALPPPSSSPVPKHELPPFATEPPLEPASFSRDSFEAIVGQAVAPDIMDILCASCGDDMERAVNMYFDGTWKHKLKNKAKAAAQRSRIAAAAKTTTEQSIAGPAVASRCKASHPSSNGTAVPEQRYLGAFGVEGWATRSGANLLRHGDKVRIERQKIETPTVSGGWVKRGGGNATTAAKATSKLGPAVIVRPNSAAARRVDVIVRFTSLGGLELGRLSKDAAHWVSTLLDQHICRFEAICVYAPERLRTNDTVVLQLRCFILRSAFHEAPLRPAADSNRSTGLYEEKETAEERGLRLRQVALVRLLQEVNLLPTRGNVAAAQRDRLDLLAAAEMVESTEKETESGQKTASPSDEPEDGQELEQDQLDALYRKAQSFDFATPEAEPPASFALSLRPYQKQALHWMLSKEKNEAAAAAAEGESLHPLWEEYAWPCRDADDHDLPLVPGQAHFYVNPYSGDLSLDFPVQDQHCLGGILADEMGLGKTIQMLSLVHAHKSAVALEVRQATEKTTPGIVNGLQRMRSRRPGVVDAPCTTLVVAPMSLLAQWQSEAEKASAEGTLRSMVYYGADKATDLQALCAADQAATAPDLVITSYGVVLSEFTQLLTRGGNGLFSLHFFRIILDEAHTIKNRQSKTAKACYALAAEHRWVLTGTPVVNRLEDLFSLIRFLRVEPWNNFSFWRTFITVPFESKDFMRALDVVQTVLEPLVMRRTKDMKTPDGEPLVALPPKHVQIIEVELSKAEREIYDHIFLRVKRSLTANVEAGTVMKSYTSIFAQVLRLRQCCCHPVLVRNMDVVADEVAADVAADAAAGLSDDMDLQALVERFMATTDDAPGANAFGAHVLRQIRDEAVNECPICAEEPMVQQTVTGCWHSACKACLLRLIEHETDRHRQPRCFHCREAITRRDLFEVVRYDDDPDTVAGAPRISLQRVDVNASSAKVVRLIEHLRALRRSRPTIKLVVFSQFTSFLSLIEPALVRANMRFLRLDGTMAQKARVEVLEAFRQADHFTVLLISLRAGGVGLNLTTAKRVYVMDPWWSFAVEAQAIDRVHRMGQDEAVEVYRFIVKGSVEEKMLKIQDRKKFIATSLGMMTDEEKKLQRIEDIKELLS